MCNAATLQNNAPLRPRLGYNLRILTTQMTSEEGQRPWGGGIWPNKLHMGIFFFEKAVQQGSVAHAETSGK